jgi:hypothetical protein
MFIKITLPGQKKISNTFSSKVEEDSRNIIRDVSREAEGFADGTRYSL